MHSHLLFGWPKESTPSPSYIYSYATNRVVYPSKCVPNKSVIIWVYTQLKYPPNQVVGYIPIPKYPPNWKGYFDAPKVAINRSFCTYRPGFWPLKYPTGEDFGDKLTFVLNSYVENDTQVKYPNTQQITLGFGYLPNYPPNEILPWVYPTTHPPKHILPWVHNPDHDYWVSLGSSVGWAQPLQ